MAVCCQCETHECTFSQSARFANATADGMYVYVCSMYVCMCVCMDVWMYAQWSLSQGVNDPVLCHVSFYQQRPLFEKTANKRGCFSDENL
jgi:hypothetical protein